MALRLEGILSYIDDFSRLKVVFIDDVDPSDETRRKLTAHCLSDRVPYTESDFTVSLPKKGDVPEDIKRLVGLRVIIHAKLVAYCLKSRLEKNKGETIRGVRLVLENIVHKGAK